MKTILATLLIGVLVILSSCGVPDEAQSTAVSTDDFSTVTSQESSASDDVSETESGDTGKFEIQQSYNGAHIAVNDVTGEKKLVNADGTDIEGLPVFTSPSGTFCLSGVLPVVYKDGGKNERGVILTAGDGEFVLKPYGYGEKAAAEQAFKGKLVGVINSFLSALRANDAAELEKIATPDIARAATEKADGNGYDALSYSLSALRETYVRPVKPHDDLFAPWDGDTRIYDENAVFFYINEEKDGKTTACYAASYADAPFVCGVFFTLRCDGADGFTVCDVSVLEDFSFLANDMLEAELEYREWLNAK